MQCPHCKTNNSPNSVRCSNCGTVFPQADATLAGTNIGVAEAWTAPVGTTVIQQLVASAPIAPGAVLAGRYEILQLLGQGGMGAVYKARDNELDRLVAVKLVRPEYSSHPEILRRFKQELILARAVTHRNVVRIFDLGQADGLKFITMEYVEGRDLRSVLHEKGKLTPSEAVTVMLQVCRALDAAHAEGVVHRDLKPQNIMLDAQNRVYVMDFGIARSSEMSGMTQTGMLMGTPEYMSPEQARGQHVDARSDLFALGIIFYELLTGKSPYQADTTMATLWKRTQERSRPPIELESSIPKPLSDAVQKCLEIETKDRYQSAGEIINDLEAWQATGKTTGGRPLILPTPASAYWKWIAAGLAVVLVAGAAAFHFKGPAKTKAPHAPISVLIADFDNYTGDPIFDDTLEPMCGNALEGASFINLFSRGTARKEAAKLSHPTDKLDEESARLVAINQGIAAVILGSLSRRGDGYRITLEALDATTGKSLASSEAAAASKDEVLLKIPKLVAPIRKALGDTTPESVQLQAMEGTTSTGNLEAAHLYGLGQARQLAGNWQEALQYFSKAVELDPNFAHAYSAMAAVSRILGNSQNADKFIKLAMMHIDRTTQRERYRIRGLFYTYNGDYPKCIEEYSALLNAYPSDSVGYINLGRCYIEMHSYPEAVSAYQHGLEITPNITVLRMNLAVLSSYTGDFPAAERNIQKVLLANPSMDKAYWILAMAQLGEGQLAKAEQTYQELAKVDALGASLSASGIADIAIYEGRFSEAVRALQSSIGKEMASKGSAVAEKYILVAYAQLQWGHKEQAMEAAKLALSRSQEEYVRFLAARIFAEAGRRDEAQALSKELGLQSGIGPQTFSKLIDGEIALFQEKDPRKAIQIFTEANKAMPTWIGWFDLGRAYLEAGQAVEANSEFDRCLKERGQAMDILEQTTTFGYVAPAYYYLARTEEALGSPGAADSYRKFMDIQAKGDGGALFLDAKKRLAALPAAAKK